MKKSEIFLSVSALLLTVAGIYASKASKIHHRIAGYIITDQGGCMRVLPHLFTGTRIQLAGLHTVITNGRTVFTNPGCTRTMFAILNSQ